MADKRPTELTTEETNFRGFVHSDDATNGSRKFNLARVLERLIERSPRPRRISDGSTSNRAERVQYGTVGALASAPYAYLEADNVLVPASAPSSNFVLATYTTSATSAPTGQAHSLVWYIEATTGYLVLLETGATPATDYRRYASDASICTGTAYRARLTAAITGGSTTAPVFKTAGATIAGTETTGAGTDPDWLHASLVNTWTLFNYNAPASDVPDVRIYNALWTDTEGNTWTAGGPRPTWAERAGNMVNAYSQAGALIVGASDSATDPTNVGWSGGGVQSVQAGARTGGAGAYYLRRVHTSGAWRVAYGGPILQIAGRSAIIGLWLRSDTPITCRLGFTNAGTNASDTVEVSVTTSWQLFYVRVTFTVTSTTTPLLSIGTISGACTLDADDATIMPAGSFDAPITQPGLTTGDAFARFSRRLVGITSHALTDRGTLYLNTATSGDEQALGGALFDSTQYVLDGPIEQLTKTGTPTTKIGHTSGGTEYKANAAVTAGINVLTAVTRKLGGTSIYVGSSDTTKVRTVIPFRRLTTPAD